MRVIGPNASAVATPSSKSRRAASTGGFALESEETAQSTAAPAAALRTIGGIDALIALQSEDEPAGRRKRAVTRGRVALDALDELKHALLAGALEPATLLRLRSVASELKGDSGEPGLDSVLKEIELRVEVEIAKLTSRKVQDGQQRADR
jgi:hypothetical protein